MQGGWSDGTSVLPAAEDSEAWTRVCQAVMRRSSFTAVLFDSVVLGMAVYSGNQGADVRI